MAMHYNIADLYELVADKVPARSALVCGDQRATFKELDQRANKLAHYLASEGVGPGDHVGLYLYNCNEYLEGMLACFKIRAVPINVNYRYVQEELLYIFDNADMVACIHNQEFIPHIDEVRASAVDLKTFICVMDESGCDPALIGSIECRSMSTIVMCKKSCCISSIMRIWWRAFIIRSSFRTSMRCVLRRLTSRRLSA